MGNYDDFDLDLKEIRSRGSNITSEATYGYVCTKIIDTLIRTLIKTYAECTKDDCPVPSRDYEHRSCRGPLNDGTIQINC